MGRTKWTEKLHELNGLADKLGVGAVMIGLGRNHPTGVHAEFVVELPVGTSADLNDPLEREVYYDHFYEDRGYGITMGWGDTIAEAVTTLWARLVWDVKAPNYIRASVKDGQILCARRNMTTVDWDFFDPPDLQLPAD